MSPRLIALCLAALLPLAAATAKKAETSQILKVETLEDFDAQAKSVREEMAEGGRYEFIKPDERERVERLLGQVRTVLEKTPSVDNLDKKQTVTVLNAQEEINGILARRDSNRMVCERTAPVGSHIPQTQCATYGEREKARRNTADYARQQQLRATQCGRDNPASC